MGKQSLDAIVKNIAEQIENSRYLRDELGLKVHEYTVDADLIFAQAQYQLSNLIEEVGNPNPQEVSRRLTSLRKLTDKYTEDIYNDLKTAKVDAKISFRRGSNKTSFVAVISSAGKKSRKGNPIDIFKTLNSRRTKKLLPDLRESILIEVFSNTKTDSLDTAIYGNYQTDKNTGELIVNKKGEHVRSGGLFQLGHEKDGSVSIRRKAELLKKFSSKTGASTILANTKLSKDVKATVAMAVSTYAKGEAGKLLKEFTTTIRVSEESAFGNQQDSSKEKKKLNDLRNEVREYLLNKIDLFSTRTSSSAVEIGIYRLEKSMEKLKPKFTNKSKASSGKTNSSKQSIESTTKVTSSNESIQGSKIPYNSPKLSETRRNWNSLLPIINSKLPPAVIANMKFPSLVNRTGRFAQSAEVVRIEETREGFPSFVFNYERDPYDVFDRTLGREPWNTPMRDPRALVDKSVRDIVREMAIGRFYTRRA